MPRLGRLRDAHPEFELSLTTRIHDSLGESRVLDCAIRFGDGEWDGFDNALLMQEQHIAVCAPALRGCDRTRADRPEPLHAAACSPPTTSATSPGSTG